MKESLKKLFWTNVRRLQQKPEKLPNMHSVKVAYGKIHKNIFIWQNLYEIKVNRNIKLVHTHLVKLAGLKGLSF